MHSANDLRYEIRFQPIAAGRTLAFPCDAQGRVDLDRLCDRARDRYFYARKVIGHQYWPPALVIEPACD